LPFAGSHTGPGGQVSAWLAGDEERDVVEDEGLGQDRVPAHREQEGVETVAGEFSLGLGVLCADGHNVDVRKLHVGETVQSDE